MNRKLGMLFLGTLALLAGGCNQRDSGDHVVSQHYIHKYGYAVSKEEWESKNYPGQVITRLENGVTITATYENHMLHGPCTHTFPHSQTIETYFLYNQGNLVKEIVYNLQGMPVRETVQLSPTRYSLTYWYKDGSPLSVEEYVGEELLEGQYFTAQNETESRVEKGNGKRVRRNNEGVLLSRDVIENGYMTQRETYYPNGMPESILHYAHGKLHGEKKTFTEDGEPLSIEEWVAGNLHGKATYFKNGAKYMELYYLDGKKNGVETHYLDGNEVSQEIEWENDKKHGVSTYYVNGIAQMRWYYDGEEVSQKKYEEFMHRDVTISRVSPQLTKSHPE